MSSCKGFIITVKKNGCDGTRYPFTNDTCTIGSSSDCNIRFAGSNVKEKLCLVKSVPGNKVTISNLSSNVPVLLNGNPIDSEPNELNSGDVFTILERTFRWEYELDAVSKSHFRKSISFLDQLKKDDSTPRRYSAEQAVAFFSLKSKKPVAIVSPQRRVDEKKKLDELEINASVPVTLIRSPRNRTSLNVANVTSANEDEMSNIPNTNVTSNDQNVYDGMSARRSANAYRSCISEYLANRFSLRRSSKHSNLKRLNANRSLNIAPKPKKISVGRRSVATVQKLRNDTPDKNKMAALRASHGKIAWQAYTKKHPMRTDEAKASTNNEDSVYSPSNTVHTMSSISLTSDLTGNSPGSVFDVTETQKHGTSPFGQGKQCHSTPKSGKKLSNPIQISLDDGFEEHIYSGFASNSMSFAQGNIGASSQMHTTVSAVVGFADSKPEAISNTSSQFNSSTFSISDSSTVCKTKSISSQKSPEQSNKTHVMDDTSLYSRNTRHKSSMLKKTLESTDAISGLVTTPEKEADGSHSFVDFSNEGVEPSTEQDGETTANMDRCTRNLWRRPSSPINLSESEIFTPIKDDSFVMSTTSTPLNTDCGRKKRFASNVPLVGTPSHVYRTRDSVHASPKPTSDEMSSLLKNMPIAIPQSDTATVEPSPKLRDSSVSLRSSSRQSTPIRVKPIPGMERLSLHSPIIENADMEKVELQNMLKNVTTRKRNRKRILRSVGDGIGAKDKNLSSIESGEENSDYGEDKLPRKDTKSLKSILTPGPKCGVFRKDRSSKKVTFKPDVSSLYFDKTQSLSSMRMGDEFIDNQSLEESEDSGEFQLIENSSDDLTELLADSHSVYTLGRRIRNVSSFTEDSKSEINNSNETSMFSLQSQFPDDNLNCSVMEVTPKKRSRSSFSKRQPTPAKIKSSLSFSKRPPTPAKIKSFLINSLKVYETSQNLSVPNDSGSKGASSFSTKRQDLPACRRSSRRSRSYSPKSRSGINAHSIDNYDEKQLMTSTLSETIDSLKHDASSKFQSVENLTLTPSTTIENVEIHTDNTSICSPDVSTVERDIDMSDIRPLDSSIYSNTSTNIADSMTAFKDIVALNTPNSCRVDKNRSSIIDEIKKTSSANKSKRVSLSKHLEMKRNLSEELTREYVEENLDDNVGLRDKSVTDNNIASETSSNIMDQLNDIILDSKTGALSPVNALESMNVSDSMKLVRRSTRKSLEASNQSIIGVPTRKSLEITGSDPEVAAVTEVVPNTPRRTYRSVINQLSTAIASSESGTIMPSEVRGFEKADYISEARTTRKSIQQSLLEDKISLKNSSFAEPMPDVSCKKSLNNTSDVQVQSTRRSIRKSFENSLGKDSSNGNLSTKARSIVKRANSPNNTSDIGAQPARRSTRSSLDSLNGLSTEMTPVAIHKKSVVDVSDTQVSSVRKSVKNAVQNYVIEDHVSSMNSLSIESCPNLNQKKSPNNTINIKKKLARTSIEKSFERFLPVDTISSKDSLFTETSPDLKCTKSPPSNIRVEQLRGSLRNSLFEDVSSSDVLLIEASSEVKHTKSNNTSDIQIQSTRRSIRNSLEHSLPKNKVITKEGLNIEISPDVKHEESPAVDIHAQPARRSVTNWLEDFISSKDCLSAEISRDAKHKMSSNDKSDIQEQLAQTNIRNSLELSLQEDTSKNNSSDVERKSPNMSVIQALPVRRSLRNSLESSLPEGVIAIESCSVEKLNEPGQDMINLNKSEKLSITPQKNTPFEVASFASLENSISNCPSTRTSLQKQVDIGIENISGVSFQEADSTVGSDENSETDKLILTSAKRALGTPKHQRSIFINISCDKTSRKTPKPRNQRNTLVNVSCVKRLMKTPKTPNQGYDNMTGVRRLLRTPRSPNQSYDNLRDAKHLLKTPKAETSNNDQILNIKRLLKTPKNPNSGYEDVAGLKNLVKTPRVAKTPALDGVKHLYGRDPIPENVRTESIRTLFQSPRSPTDNSLTGIKTLFYPDTLPDRETASSSARSLMASHVNVEGAKRLINNCSPTQKSPDLEGLSSLFEEPTTSTADSSTHGRRKKAVLLDVNSRCHRVSKVPGRSVAVSSEDETQKTNAESNLAEDKLKQKKSVRKSAARKRLVAEEELPTIDEAPIISPPVRVTRNRGKRKSVHFNILDEIRLFHSREIPLHTDSQFFATKNVESDSDSAREEPIKSRRKKVTLAAEVVKPNTTEPKITAPVQSVENPLAKTRKSRLFSVPESSKVEIMETDDSKKEAITRRRTRAFTEIENTIEVQVQTVKRTRTAIQKAEPETKKVVLRGRGRSLSKVNSKPAETVNADTVESVVEGIQRRGRGRMMNSKEPLNVVSTDPAVEEIKPKGRGRKALPKSENKAASSVATIDDHCEPTVVKITRGRARKPVTTSNMQQPESAEEIKQIAPKKRAVRVVTAKKSYTPTRLRKRVSKSPAGRASSRGVVKTRAIATKRLSTTKTMSKVANGVSASTRATISKGSVTKTSKSTADTKITKRMPVAKTTKNVTNAKAAKNVTDAKTAKNVTDAKTAKNVTDPKTAKNVTDAKNVTVAKAAKNVADAKTAKKVTVAKTAKKVTVAKTAKRVTIAKTSKLTSVAKMEKHVSISPVVSTRPGKRAVRSTVNQTNNVRPRITRANASKK